MTASCSTGSNRSSSLKDEFRNNNIKPDVIPLSLAIVYVSYRIAVANYSPITDCDETYNYWEPLHFIQFNFGMQTWEYAQPYELRTYAFLFPYFICSKLLESLFSLNKKIIFYAIRSTIGAITAICELHFVQGISNVFGISLSITTLLCLAVSPGMFHASSALLPSTAAMQLVMMSVGHTLQNYDANNNNYFEQIPIFFGLLATLCTGWPFAAALFVPLGLRAIYLASTASHNATTNGTVIANICRLLIRTLFHASLIQAIVTAIDYYYYQKITFPSWNILKYNAMQGGDEVYGVEPISYYIKNVLLNFNFIAVGAGFSVVPFLFTLFQTKNKQQQYYLNAMLYSISPMMIWLLLVCPRPHKEERFLFPIYPFIALACAYALQEVTMAFSAVAGNFLIRDPKHKQENQKKLMEKWIRALVFFGFFFPTSIVSISRSYALYNYYTGPLSLYSFFYDTIHNDKPIALCVAGEWYRFVGSYMLPNGTTLQYLPSSFKGQLPQPFLPSLGSAAKPGQFIQPFNDLNLEEPSRVVGIDSCDYVIELVPPTGDDALLVPDAVKLMRKHEWVEIASYPFLDAESTTGTLVRTLYLPSWLSKKIGMHIHFAKYALFQRKVVLDASS